ncbi:hypothetical protein HHI36_012472 [Cryptolaemus montrouzieri]|uniref:Peroxidase n=1 Tax=Cryptolaemus montrouzieri TaxID=559131 RepID=A0ABD2NFG6_9CUCU
MSSADLYIKTEVIGRRDREFKMFRVSPYILIVVALYVAYTHGWSSDDEMKDTLETLKRSVISTFAKKKFTDQDFNRTITFAQDIYERMSTRETLLGYADIKVAKGTPSHRQYLENLPEPEALELMKDSLVAVAATAQIVYEFCDANKINHEDCSNTLKYFKLWNTPLSKICKKLNQKCTREEIHSKYRSFDGSCNNVDDEDKGKSFTVYGRLLNPNYIDGIREPRRSVTKESMVSPRTVSANLYLDHTVDKKRSLAALYWGQFIEHDLSHTAMSEMVHTRAQIECCNPEGRINSPRYVHPFCFPIKVSSRDQYYATKDISCLSYVRSIPAVGPDCALGPMQQINQATHYLDASQIYGTTRTRLEKLRSMTKGQMVVSQAKNSSHLPLSKDSEQNCQTLNGKTSCFEAGDKRVNLNPHMTTLYTLWVREHNRIAAALATLNPNWDDETVFHETRRIVIAEIQHITYSEWIPTVLGIHIGGHYVPDEDPSVSNAFATAGIRAIQSIGSGKLSLSQEEKKHESISSKTTDKLLMDMTTQYITGKGLEYIGEINNKIYGYDILSIDIQRGRDHGLPTYNEYRKFCGLKKIDNFKNLDGVMLPKTVDSLQKIYKSEEDIDLIIGALSEKPQKGLFGPTLTCILANQFERTKKADRYFYESDEQPMPFSESQLDEIKKVTFARIICDNSDKVEKVQPRVFEAISDKNAPVSCDSEAIHKINLELWDNKRYLYT